MPHQLLKKIEPGLRELRAGAPVHLVLREVALMDALVGSGLAPSEAARAVQGAALPEIGRSAGTSSSVSWAPAGMTDWLFAIGPQVPTGPWL